MANQPPYGFSTSGSTPHPPSSHTPYPISDNPPPYSSDSNPPFNPSYVPPNENSFATAPLISQQTPTPLNYNAPQYPYNQNAPPPMQYSGIPQNPPPNIVALNSVPGRNTYYGANYGPGWYRYSPAARKKVFIIFGVCAGIMMGIFIIVFVTMTIRAQNEHAAFRKEHFGH